MPDSTLDMLRKDAIIKRVKGIACGNHIAWSAKDIALIRDFGMAMPERTIRAASTTVSKFVNVEDTAAVRQRFVKAGLAFKADMQPDDLNFLFTISSEQIDLAGDVVTAAGIDCVNFNKNPIVPFGHNSSGLPIATSSAPWLSNNKLMAIAKFPPPGTNAESDQVAAAIRASLVRAASIGFTPVKWVFSKDPARPFGVDFKSVRLHEWSCVSLPCNPDCLLIGAVSGSKGFSPPDPSSSARAERMAQAAEFRRLAYRV